MTPQAQASFHTAQRLQVLCACTLCFFMGATFSVGAFTLPVEHAARPPGALDGVWPAAVGIVHLLSSLLMLTAGLVFSNVSPQFRNAAARTLALLGCAAFALSGLFAAAGIARSARGLVATGVSLHAAPLGLWTVLATELLLRWLPKRPGLAVALVALLFNAGAIVSAWMYTTFLDAFPVAQAVLASAVVLSLGTLAPALAVRFPDNSKPHLEKAICDNDGTDQVPFMDAADMDQTPEMQPLLTSRWEYPKLSVREALSLWSFWCYIFCAFTAGASYALIPYFFKLGAAFGTAPETVTLAFQLSTVGSLGVCALLSVAGDAASIGEEGALSSGARNILTGMLALQAAACGTLATLGRGGFVAFATLAGALKSVLLAHNCCAALLAVDMFGHANSAFVYGVGGGLAVGSGEALSIWLLARLHERSGLREPSDARAYYVQVAVWSLLALAATLLIRRNRVRRSQSLSTRF